MIENKSPNSIPSVQGGHRQQFFTIIHQEIAPLCPETGAHLWVLAG